MAKNKKTKNQFSSKDEASEVLAKAYAYLYDDAEALEKAAQRASSELVPKQIAKAIPFDDHPEDLKHGDFRYEEFNDRILINQLYNSDLRPSGITNDTLRTLYFRSDLISSIIQRRIWQLQTFAVQQTSRYDLGFSIEKRGQKDLITSRNQYDIDRLSDMVFNLGFSGYDPLRGTFQDFVRLTMQDSLVFDGASLERVYSRTGIPVAFKAIDGGCIHPKFDTAKGDFTFEEYIDGSIINSYSRDEVVYYVRNKTSDRRWFGYGVSELERLINTITCHLFAEEYNKRLFKSGHFLSGVVSLKGNISRAQFQEFKRDFYSFVTGVENTNRVAIVNAPQGIEFNNAIRSPQEMGFANFMDYLVKVASAVFMMDPVEINFFVNGGASQSQNNINMSSQEFRLKYSKDAGLRPLLSSLADFVNRAIIYLIDSDYQLVFKGLDEEDKRTRQDYIIKAKKYMTLNEVRAEEGLDPIDDPDLGNLIEDSGYIQMMTRKLDESRQQQAYQEPAEQEFVPDENERRIIESYLKDNDYDEDSIEVVLGSFDSGVLTFDDFKDYAHLTDEDLLEYAQPNSEQPEYTEPE